MLLPSPLVRPLELPTACALATSADDRSKPIINVKLRYLFPSMNKYSPFLLFITRNAAAKILNGGPHALGVRGVWTKEQVFFQLFDRAGVVLLSPVDAAKIIIGHAQL